MMKTISDAVTHRFYHGIRPVDPAGRNGLRNPERGLRLEMLLAMNGRPSIFPCAVEDVKHHVDALDYSDNWQLLAFPRYEPWGVTLSQHYCYLTEFSEVPELPPEVLEDLNSSFAVLRGLGVKSVLRFAYETELKKAYCGMPLNEEAARSMQGPSKEIILSHIRQLAPVLRANADVIYLLEMGFLGAWGEWHSMRKLELDDYPAFAEITAAVLEVLPANRMISLRYPYKTVEMLKCPPFDSMPPEITEEKAFDGSLRSRLGHHNDSFHSGFDDSLGFGVTLPEGENRSPRRGDPLYDLVMRESLFVPSGGEQWWKRYGGTFSGKEALLRLRDHHYDLFSIVHSYNPEGDENFNDWMREPIDLEWLTEHHFPVSDGYFDGFPQGERTVERRTAFEYLRDHLGYRFELQEAAWSNPVSGGGELSLAFALINRGFKGMVNPRPVFAVLIDRHGQVVFEWRLDCDPRRWHPHRPGDELQWNPVRHEVSAQMTLPDSLAPGRYLIGLWLPDESETLRHDARYAVHLANRDALWWEDVAHRYGVNTLGDLVIG